MNLSRHPTRRLAALHPLCIAAALLAASPLPSHADDDISDLVQGAKTVAPPLSPSAATRPADDLPDALGTRAVHPPPDARTATLTLNNGPILKGAVWTTVATPLRVWIDATKSYRDIDLAMLKRVEVKVLSESMEDDWRWLKEGSDRKIFSGKKYPLVELAYTFTLTNDQTVEGTVVAPIYLLETPTGKQRTLALYKKYKGTFTETLKDVVYIKSITFTDAPTPANADRTTSLPLLY